MGTACAAPHPQPASVPLQAQPRQCTHMGLRSLCRMPSWVCRWSKASATSCATWRPLQHTEVPSRQAESGERPLGPHTSLANER